MSTPPLRGVHSLLTRVSNRVESILLRRAIPRGPLASRDAYLRAHEEEIGKEYPEISRFEEQTGYGIDRIWLDDLALTTQVSVKASGVCYQHGRVLYAALRRYIAETGEQDVTVVETGTARGFSAICMARALVDAGVNGRIITVDSVPHDVPIYWNCIDDHERAKSRRELLAPWEDLAARVVFLHGRTEAVMPRLKLTRVNVAFLDASHTERDVVFEFESVAPAQRTGDLLVFDDYTPARFPGVIAAVDRIERDFCAEGERLWASADRGYACLTRR